MANSLATLTDFSGLSLDLDESRGISMSSLKRASQKPVFSPTAAPPKRRSPHGTSSVSRTSARSKKTRTGNRKQTSSGNGFSFREDSPDDDKARKSNIEPHKAITLLEESLQEFSTYSKRKAAVLLRQFKQLIYDEKLYGNLNDDSSDINPMSINSSLQDSLSTSEVTDSEYRTDNTSVSSTPRPQTDETQDSIQMDLEPIHKPCALCGAKPIYYCTRKDCFYSVHSFTDWKRHEEGGEHWPKERFMCLQCPTGQTDLNGNSLCEFCLVPFFSLGCDARAHYLRCVTARDEGKTFGRKDHLVEHLQKEHGMSNMSPHAASWKYAVNSNWPRQCGFCGEIFQTWDQRMRHIAKHYQDGLNISSWKLPFPRPKDLQPRGPYFHPKDDSSDDDDDLDGGKGPSHTTPIPRRNSTSPVGNNHTQGRPSSTSQGNSSSHDSEQRRRQNVEELFEGSKDHKPTDLPRLVKPSLALERYLNDTEESIPAALNLGSSSPSSDFSPQIDGFHLNPQTSDILEGTSMSTESMSKHPQVVSSPFHSTSEAQRLILRELDSKELFLQRDLELPSKMPSSKSGERQIQPTPTKYKEPDTLNLRAGESNTVEDSQAAVGLLLEKGANVDSKGSTDRQMLLSCAARKWHEAVMQLLLEHKAGVGANNKNRQTALHAAAGNGHKAVVQLQKLDSKDSDCWTPPSWAAPNGQEAVVKLLVEQSAELNSKDGRGQMPLSLVAQMGHEAVAKLLLEWGAELDSKDNYTSYQIRSFAVLHRQSTGNDDDSFNHDQANRDYQDGNDVYDPDDVGKKRFFFRASNPVRPYFGEEGSFLVRENDHEQRQQPPRHDIVPRAYDSESSQEPSRRHRHVFSVTGMGSPDSQRGRKRKLTQEEKDRILEVRKDGACWACHLSKTKVCPILDTRLDRD
jgi:ankyrin repeat protein